jgi:hypothetical protein
VNPAGKLTSIIAGMAALGQFLREFTHGHTLQLASVARAYLVHLAERTDLLPGIEQQAYVDIDSLLGPVYGHAKQGASFGHTKIAGKQCSARDSRRWRPRSAPGSRRRWSPGSGSGPGRPDRVAVQDRW